MEVGGGGAYGIPADEVGDRKVIATLVEVGPEGLTIQVGDVVTEEDGVGDAQRQLPLSGLIAGVERCTTQGSPTVNLSGYFRCC